MKHNIDTKELASVFAGLLRGVLDDHQWFAMLAQNKAETHPNICHSHDYCDANEVMATALSVLGVQPNDFDANDEEQAAQWSEAWRIASVRYLGRRAALNKAGGA